MAGDDDFQLWLGHIGPDRPFLHRVRRSAKPDGRHPPYRECSAGTLRSGHRTRAGR